MVQDSWPAHYQIFLIILVKEFIKLNANIGIIIKKSKTSGIKYKDCECCLEYTNIKDDLILYKCLCCYRNCQKVFYGNLRDLLIHTNVLTMTLIGLFCCCKKVFTYRDDTWMIGKNSMKHHYQRKKIFTVT